MKSIENFEPKPYIQGERVAEAGGRFEHVMAVTLDPQTDYKEGVIRCIVSREGDLAISGFVDRSELHHITKNESGKFDIGERLVIKNEEEILEKLGGDDWECIGLEDPDIFIDDNSGLMHLYFTLPFRHRTEKKMHIHLGHAAGKNLNSLKMTTPVLECKDDGKLNAKEVSIAPPNSEGVRLNLFESRDKINNISYSTVRVAKAKNMGEPWEFGEVLFHPAEHDIPWAGEHASPGPLFSKSFIDIGENKLLGIMNGREKSEMVEGKKLYKTFSVGLFIYDYEKGKIDWVSPEPMIIDSDAKIITFASQFVETKPGEGILYAHVDDSFVRSYELNAEGIKNLLPKS